MTGQDGGFQAARARFSAAVEAALTRARRTAGEAKAQSAGFQRATGELAEQAKTGRLRDVHRGEVRPTAAEPRDEAAKFRDANGLPVDEFPDAARLTALDGSPDELPDAARPTARVPADQSAPRQEDEDFSQHQVLFDVDALDLDEAAPSAGADSSDRKTAEVDSPESTDTRPSDEDDDFSQQRILIDATVESYRPEVLPGSVFEFPDEQTPS